MITAEQVVIRSPSDLQAYESVWQAMRDFTNQRTSESLDEIWLLEHTPVYTQGQNGKPEHVLDPKNIPIVQSDRGGQVTYHGPGQLIAYTLIDLNRKKMNIRQLVTALEKSVIDLLAAENIVARSDCKAPGVYVNDHKICSVGLRVRRGCSFHGLALNVAMDLGPFKHINPCGFEQLQMTQVSALLPKYDLGMAKAKLIQYLVKNLGYNNSQIQVDSLNGTQNPSTE